MSLNTDALPHLLKHSTCVFKSSELACLIEQCPKKEKLYELLNNYTYQDNQTQDIYEEIYKHLVQHFDFRQEVQSVKTLAKCFKLGTIEFAPFTLRLFTTFKMVYEGLMTTIEDQKKYYESPKDFYYTVYPNKKWENNPIWHEAYDKQIAFILDKCALLQHSSIKTLSFVNTSGFMDFGGISFPKEWVANLHLLQTIVKKRQNQEDLMIEFIEHKEHIELAQRLAIELPHKNYKAKAKI